MPKKITGVAHAKSPSKPLSANGKGAPSKKIRYAVVGLGYISQIAVLPAFAHARENSELVALVSGDERKLKTLGKKYNVVADQCYSYDRYGDCLKSGLIDAVYIALPNNLHRTYSVAAAEAGIHILCEKPMAMDQDECESVILAAEEANVKLMIAYRLHFERGNLEAIKIVNSGKIGVPRIFTSTFSQQVAAGNSRLKVGVGGGAIYDMGTYCINASRYLFKAEPEEVFAYNLNGGDARFKEIPEMTSGLMKFPGDRIASFTTSFGATSRSIYEVVGTKGVMKMDPAYDMKKDLAGELTVGEKKNKMTFPKRDQFAPELIYFSDCVLNDRKPEPSGEEGLADVRIIRALLESAESGKPVKVEAILQKRRPAMHQEISRPAVRGPELVNAAAPSR